jgi:MOSC domain-containing protein YiiM
MNKQGRVVGLFIAEVAGAPMISVPEVRAVPDRGLEGDRYFFGQGSFSRWPGPHRDVTWIAVEDIWAVNEEFGLDLEPIALRRNILVEGVPLNSLLKQTLHIGSVTFRAERLCQPCKYLARKLDVPDLVTAFSYRAGIRARILTNGYIRVGDVVHFEEQHHAHS